MRRLIVCLGLTAIVALAGAGATLADPVLSLPGTVTVNVENVTSGVATFSVSAVDSNDNSALPVTCDHTSGDTFPLGTTTVHCSATDGTLTAADSFDVVVQDTTFPVLNLPSPVIEVVGTPSTTTVNYTATATDGATAGARPHPARASATARPTSPATRRTEQGIPRTAASTWSSMTRSRRH